MKRITLLSLANLLMICFGFGQLRLPALVSDSMVLQRDKPVKIWGWSMGGDDVSVTFKGSRFHAKPTANKRWEMTLPATKVGGPYQLIISAGKSVITVKEVLFGDVWLCSGQSNMGFSMQELSFKYPNDLANSENRFIREFAVGKIFSFIPKETVSGNWKRACPANIGKFSAVAYYMAKNLYDKYKVPIGIIHSSWGGTPAEAWTSETGLKDFNNYLERLPLLRDSIKTDSIKNRDKSITSDWYHKAKEKDRGIYNNEKPWYSEDINTIDWKNMKVPGYWENFGAKNVYGIVWARKEIILTKEMIAHDALLNLGMIEDEDTTYFNGIKIGSSPNKYAFRRYNVPARLLREGTNVITVRMLNTDGPGGFIKDRKYNLVVDNQEVDLNGNWKYQIGASIPELPAGSFTHFNREPTGLYYGMIDPLKSYTIKGVAWYQGEQNATATSSYEYRKLLPAMINDWRKQFAQGDFPFLIVQLANLSAPKAEPSECNWSVLRESQLLTAKNVSNCALVVTIDIGEASNIHPLNKMEVGRRLALAAEKMAYNEENVYSGPTYESMKIEGDKIILSFSNIGGGLVSKGDAELKQFAIAGEDKKFVWAKAVIKGNQIIVQSDAVTKPVAVRYAWAYNPFGCNLYNKEELPASPFRTDEWKQGDAK